VCHFGPVAKLQELCSLLKDTGTLLQCHSPTGNQTLMDQSKSAAGPGVSGLLSRNCRLDNVSLLGLDREEETHVHLLVSEGVAF